MQQKAKYEAEAAYYSTYADELRIPIGVAKITLGVTAGAGVIVGGAAIATGVTTVGSVGSAISLAVGHSAEVVSSITSIMSGVMEISGASPEKINSVDTITNYAGWAKLGASMVGLPSGDFVSKLDFVSSAVNVIINQF